MKNILKILKISHYFFVDPIITRWLLVRNLFVIYNVYKGLLDYPLTGRTLLYFMGETSGMLGATSIQKFRVLDTYKASDVFFYYFFLFYFGVYSTGKIWQNIIINSVLNRFWTVISFIKFLITCERKLNLKKQFLENFKIGLH